MKPDIAMLLGLISAFLIFGFAAEKQQGVAAEKSATRETKAATVLIGDRAVRVEKPRIEAGELWVVSGTLQKINNCQIKPEGVCIGQVCIPITERERAELVRTWDKEEYVSLTKLAAKLNQAVVADVDERVWSFGPSSQTQKEQLQSFMAPDFTLTDRKGNKIRLADFVRKKVLLLTWASW